MTCCRSRASSSPTPLHTVRPRSSNHMAIGKLFEPGEILVDHQDGMAFVAQQLKAAPDIGPYRRREAFRRFVEDQQARMVINNIILILCTF